MECFDIKWDMSKVCPVILLEGDITGDSSDKIQEAYNRIKSEKHTETVIFDFTNSKYINSSGISIFIQMLQEYQEHNGRFIFTGLNEHMSKVLDIVGITEYITICDSIDSAFDLSKNK